MLVRLIDGSARNPILVILCVVLLASWGLWAGFQVPLDAVPDLSDVQVTIYTEWQGRSPTLIEDQVTYPIVTSCWPGRRLNAFVGSQNMASHTSTSSSKIRRTCTGQEVVYWNTCRS